MMRTLYAACTVLLVGALVACGHDEPTRPELTPDALARQFDSLAQSSAASSSLGRSMAFAQTAQAVHLGAAPSTITIVNGDSAEQYQALAVSLDVDTSLASNRPPGTSMFMPGHMWGLVAWQGPPATGRVIAITGFADSASFDLRAAEQLATDSSMALIAPIGIGMILEHGAVRLISVNGAAVLSPQETTGPCEGSTIGCTKTTFIGHFTIDFQTAADPYYFAPDSTAPARTFTMASQVVNGIRLTP